MDLKAKLPERLLPTVRLAAHGYTPEQIACEFSLATPTIRNRIQEARDIIGAKNTVQLACWFLYKYGNIDEDLIPVTKRIGKVFIIAIMLAGVTQIDCERAFRTARRGRRNEDIEVVELT